MKVVFGVSDVADYFPVGEEQNDYHLNEDEEDDDQDEEDEEEEEEEDVLKVDNIDELHIKKESDDVNLLATTTIKQNKQSKRIPMRFSGGFRFSLAKPLKSDDCIQHKNGLSQQQFEALVKDSFLKRFDTNMRDSQCYFLNDIIAITRKPLEVITSQDIVTLRCFSEGITETKRPQRLKNSECDKLVKKISYGQFEAITDLTNIHIRACWCHFLRLCWTGVPGMDRYGEIHLKILFPEDVAESMNLAGINPEGFVFRRVLEVLSESLVAHCFNGKTLYQCPESGKKVPLPLPSDIQNELSTMVRNARKCALYYIRKTQQQQQQTATTSNDIKAVKDSYRANKKKQMDERETDEPLIIANIKQDLNERRLVDDKKRSRKG